MTEPPAPERIAVYWSPEARADLRAIDREPALQILYCLDRYLSTRTGDVKKLKPPLSGFRLRKCAYTLVSKFRLLLSYAKETENRPIPFAEREQHLQCHSHRRAKLSRKSQSPQAPSNCLNIYLPGNPSRRSSNPIPTRVAKVSAVSVIQTDCAMDIRKTRRTLVGVFREKK